MPFYVSPEQVMKDKADYARKRIAQIRSGVVIDCEAGILFVAPNPSRALRKFSEMYDRIAFAAVGRYNEFESLRKAGVRYADMTGFQYDRQDVNARGLANWYGQLLGSLFTDSNKPYEVEIVVAEVGITADADEIYRITFEGSVADEHGFVVMGGQADKVAAVLKERYAAGMSLTAAMTLAIAALGGQGDGANAEPVTASQLEVALLERSRTHRAFRRLTGARLDALLAESMPKAATTTGETTGTEPAGAEQNGRESGSAGPGSGPPDGAGEPGNGSNGSGS
ncbi:MAG TPA: proteasome subunit alpha [Streptosporangiaceae bacterium]|jgi:proteasome alpha subunit|nr:proteasome subunit alpha [Streptosporangiaceae bacterium]